MISHAKGMLDKQTLTDRIPVTPLPCIVKNGQLWLVMGLNSVRDGDTGWLLITADWLRDMAEDTVVLTTLNHRCLTNLIRKTQFIFGFYFKRIGALFLCTLFWSSLVTQITLHPGAYFGKILRLFIFHQICLAIFITAQQCCCTVVLIFTRY